MMSRKTVISAWPKAEWLGMLCLILAVTVSAQENAQPFKSGEKLVITTSYGGQHAGRLLFATDSLLVLWKSQEAYNERELNELAKPLHFSEIDKIVVEKKGHFGKGAGRGFLIGGAAGAIGGAIKGIYRSTDYGETWMQINSGLTNPNVGSYCLCVGRRCCRTIRNARRCQSKRELFSWTAIAAMPFVLDNRIWPQPSLRSATAPIFSRRSNLLWHL